MSYTVDARPRVRKDLRLIDSQARKAVLAKMRSLTVDPRPPGAQPLRGHSPWLRVRVGDYRIIYVIDDEARSVTVAIVGHRSEVYRHLDL
jgi:mRNA interferase RelE/StbE